MDIRHHFAGSIVYCFDKYAVNDFATGVQTLSSIAQPSFVTIGYALRPYTANTVQARLTYFW